MPTRLRAPAAWLVEGSAAALLLAVVLAGHARANEAARAEDAQRLEAVAPAADLLPGQTPPRSPGLDSSAFESLCRSEGWGHWWDGVNCLTSEEARRLTREQALDVIRRTFGKHRPLM